jgi:hypothetical protein
MYPCQINSRQMAALLALVTFLVTSSSLVVAADTAPKRDQPQATAAPAPKSDSSAASGMMQQMQVMHAEMMAAKTPAERAALMQAHMALMQSGMSMMQGMHGSSAQRLDMMQMMMQMMMDRMSEPAPAPQKPEAPKK